MRPYQRRESGFTLLELTITVALAAGFFMAMMIYWQTETLRAQSRMAGQQYRLINEAVTEYMALFHQNLLYLPDDCSWVTLAAIQSLASSASVQSGKCRLVLSAVDADKNSVHVENGLQPTIEELQSLRLLNVSLKNMLALPTQAVVAQPRHHSPSNELVAPRYAIQIQKFCAAQTCQSDQITGLVYNTQPFAQRYSQSLISSHELLRDVLIAAGPDAALSQAPALLGDGELHGFRDSFNLKNPLRTYSAGTSVGLADILAVRSGYGSATMSQFARIDGSHQTTGNWNFNGHDVLGLKTIEVQQIAAEEANVKTLNASDGSIRDLRVSNTASVKNLEVQNLRLPNAQAGAACTANTQSIALSFNGVEILQCNQSKWTTIGAALNKSY